MSTLQSEAVVATREAKHSSVEPQHEDRQGLEVRPFDFEDV
jgi:hypothetical protein